MNLLTLSSPKSPNLYSFGQACYPITVWKYALKSPVWSVPICDFEQPSSSSTWKQSFSFSAGFASQSIAAKELSSEPWKCSPRSRLTVAAKLFCLGLFQELWGLGLQSCLRFHFCLWFCRLNLLRIVKDPQHLPYHGLIHCLGATQNLVCSPSHRHHLMMH